MTMNDASEVSVSISKKWYYHSVLVRYYPGIIVWKSYYVAYCWSRDCYRYTRLDR